MKKILYILLAGILTLPVFAQQGKDGAGVVNAAGTIVNSYTTLSADVAAGATTITVANAAAFSAGDLVYIIQMQGAAVNVINGAFVGPWYDGQAAEPTDTTFGRVTALNGAGNNEYAEINSISGTTLTLNCGLANAYLTAGKTQVVRVPRYTSLSIGASGVITCPHWDATLGYGGVIAIEVHGNTTIASGGKIDASGLGFHGGAFWNKSVSNPGGTRYGAIYRTEGCNKGESIAGDTTQYGVWAAKFCKGSIANGGGGGNSVNAGGGGGANAGIFSAYKGGIGNIDTTSYTNLVTAWSLEGAAMMTMWRSSVNSGGGRGGYTFSSSTSNPLTTAPGSGSWSGDSRRPQGGLGGRPLDYSGGELYLGGGGGAGDGENWYQGAGGDGGGIITLISYGTVSGGGQIISNGANGSNSYIGSARNGDGFGAIWGRDGAGGGGGGGAIQIKSTGAVTGVSFSSTGGKGGTSNMDNGHGGGTTAQAYGPGGGGGGGYINLPTGTAVTTSVNAGLNGIVTFVAGLENCKIDNTNGTGFPPNGATKGGPGVMSASTTTFSITTTGATICSGNTAVITASLNGTVPSPITINWYTAAVGGSPVATGSSYTTTALSSTTTYYVGTCPGIYREPVIVTVTTAPAAPAVTSPVNYCLNATASQLSATAGGGNTLLWWGTASTGGTSSATAPTPSTSAAGSTTYYVSQANGSCESTRQPIVVDIQNLPNAPAVTSPVNFCVNGTASPLSATPNGTDNLLWWGTASTGGTSSASAPTPPTSTVGSSTYYVSETNGACESSRTPITVNINALPSPPSVTDTVSYCQNQAASQLTPNGASINWYATATGGSSMAAPTPNTSTVGTTTYYVSQVQGGCESNRDSVKVIVNTSYLAPAVTNASYCLGDAATDLSSNATGTATLNWWGTAASGGTSSATAPTPSTASAGTTSYYVSQGAGSCESNRSQIDVVVHALPNAPAVTSPVDYCQNATASSLSATANGTDNLLWWGTASTGGTSSAAAPTPSTTAAGTSTYYVSETDGTCESSRTPITVNINALPSPPAVTDTVSYCQNEAATQLTPNGAGINWYASATGGSSMPAPTPNTSTVGTTTYYVSQTQSGCESSRDSVKVIVNTSFLPPSVSNVAYCLGSTATDLSSSANGTATLNWYTSATGGTASTTAPTPSTATAGLTSYYVSQGSATCESNRAQIDVTVNTLPAAPAGTDVSYCLNEPATALTATGSGTLNWYPVATGGIASPAAPVPNTSAVGTTQYFVSQTDGNSCEGSRDTITVTVINLQNPPLTANVSYCVGTTASQLTAGGTATLNWYTAPSGGTASTTAPTPSTGTAGVTTYYVSQGTGACESPRTPLQVTVNALPNVSFTQDHSNICINDCVQFTESASAGCASVSWNFGDGATSTNSGPLHCYTTAGIYNVSVICTNAGGCKDTATVAAAVLVNPTVHAQFGVNPGAVVDPGTTVSFLADTGSVQVTYAWNFADPAGSTANTSTLYNPSHVYNEVGTYCVQLVASASNCSDTAKMCIEVIKEATISIPNIITPNGDGVNEQFVVTSSGLKTLEASIYDRWGVKLYSWSGVTGGWDAKGKAGKTVSNGVYYYIITTSNYKDEEKNYSGYVQVIGME